MLDGVGAPGPPGLGAADERGGVAEAGEAAADAEVGLEQDVGVAAAHRDVVGGPRADAAQREEGGAVARVEPAGERAAIATSERPRARGIGSVLGVELGERGRAPGRGA